MAVEVVTSEISDRQVVPITWDTEIVSGQLSKLYCVNPENGDISQSGITKNNGKGTVSFPPGYVGTSEITVSDELGNTDFGVIVVGEPGDVDESGQPVDPGYGIDIDTGYVRPDNTLPGIEEPVDPEYGIDVDAPYPDNELPAVEFPGGYNPPPGANHPTPA